LEKSFKVLLTGGSDLWDGGKQVFRKRTVVIEEKKSKKWRITKRGMGSNGQGRCPSVDRDRGYRPSKRIRRRKKEGTSFTRWRSKKPSAKLGRRRKGLGL